MKEREYPNVMAVPRLKKVVVNMGVGEATQNIKLLDAAMDELGRITGQKPGHAPLAQVDRGLQAARRACPSRPPSPCAATACTSSCDRLFNVALPRVRDFRGVPTSAFDGRGNYTLGLKDQLIFPEVDYAKVDKLRGMNVTFVTTARTDEESRAAPPVPRACRSGRSQEGAIVAKLSLIAKAPADAEVRRAQVHPLPPVRPSSGLPEEVRAVPHLLPQAGARRGHPRRHQGQLVGEARGNRR